MTSIHQRWALATGLVSLIAPASPATARELVTIRPADDTDLPGGKLGVANRAPVIEVEGIARGRYGRIRNNKLMAWIVYFGSRPDWARRFKRTDVFVDNVKAQELPGPDHPKGPYARPNGYAYPITFDYRTPGISSDPKEFKSVQTRCNEAIANAKGPDRKRYIQNGVILKLPAAYLVKVAVIWDSRGRFERGPPTASIWIGATIKCLPTGHFAATSRDTSAGSASQADIARELDKKRRKSGNNGPANESDPQSNRTNPGPMVRKFSLTTAPPRYRAIGHRICPKITRLRGRVDVLREFDGSAICLGGQWLSNLTRFNFDEIGSRYIIANHPITGSTDRCSLLCFSAPTLTGLRENIRGSSISYWSAH